MIAFRGAAALSSRSRGIAFELKLLQTSKAAARLLRSGKTARLLQDSTAAAESTGAIQHTWAKTAKLMPDGTAAADGNKAAEKRN